MVQNNVFWMARLIEFKEDLNVKGNTVQFNKVNGHGIFIINLNKAIAEGEYEFEIKDLA